LQALQAKKCFKKHAGKRRTKMLDNDQKSTKSSRKLSGNVYFF